MKFYGETFFDYKRIFAILEYRIIFFAGKITLLSKVAGLLSF